MSEFWKYFRDALSWGLIQSPGPLQAVVRGAALALDQLRDDVVYFRHQWFPALCTPELVAAHGESRGIIRHPKESAEQYRQRVVHAYRWHLLGGKTEGLPEILKFYGFNALLVESLRRYQPSRWAEFQIGLKTPVTQEAQEALLADLDTLIWLVKEYKPARSVLARLYTDTYNRLPTVWSEGPEWSGGFWSHFSGVPFPSNADKLIVSFGIAFRAQAERYNLTGAGLGIECTTGILAPYIDRPVWSRSAWSEDFPKNHGFTIGELISLHWCVRTTKSYGWRGRWDSRHWREVAAWDRVLPEWKIRGRSWAKVEAVFSWPGESGDAGEPLRLHGNGTWGDVNSCNGRPTATVVDNPPKWGDRWGHDPERRELTILERHQIVSGTQSTAVVPSVPLVCGLGALAGGTAPLRQRGWRGSWRNRRWLADVFPVALLSISSVSSHHDTPESPRMSGQDSLKGLFGAVNPSSPHTAGSVAAMVQGTPLHNQAWTGKRESRRWWEYVGQTAIRSEES